MCLPIDYAKVPNSQFLLPQMKYPYGVGHIYSGKVILYNPKLIATPPTSFADALDPKHGNKLGIIDIQYQFTMMAAALASGGSMTNYDPGKERLMACRKAGARILPTNEAMAQALQNEEVGICIMWKARAVQWQKAGAKVETVAPKEGIPLYISGFVIPKNSPNKDAAHVWLNEMLQPSAQEAFCRGHGLQRHRHQRQDSAETEKRIGFSADERKRLVDLDYSYLSKNDAAPEGVVGQNIQGLTSAESAGRTGHDCCDPIARAHRRFQLDRRRDGRAGLGGRDYRHGVADRHPVSL